MGEEGARHPLFFLPHCQETDAAPALGSLAMSQRAKRLTAPNLPELWFHPTACGRELEGMGWYSGALLLQPCKDARKELTLVQ